MCVGLDDETGGGGSRWKKMGGAPPKREGGGGLLPQTLSKCAGWYFRACALVRVFGNKRLRCLSQADQETYFWKVTVGQSSLYSHVLPLPAWRHPHPDAGTLHSQSVKFWKVLTNTGRGVPDHRRAGGWGVWV